MRKSIIPARSAYLEAPEAGWLDVASLARVEVTSEDPGHPVEDALRKEGRSGWRADASGPQTVRLRFDQPQRIRRIRLHFVEAQHERNQEFVLRWSADGKTFRDIVRQQWNFSPSGATNEIENYSVELSGVTVLELCVIPDVSGRDVRASLAELRLAH
jgi:F5/8 type C domain-containing protein